MMQQIAVDILTAEHAARKKQKTGNAMAQENVAKPQAYVDQHSNRTFFVLDDVASEK